MGCFAVEQQIPLMLLVAVDMGDENPPINTCGATSQEIAFMNDTDLYLVIDKKINDAKSFYFCTKLCGQNWKRFNWLKKKERVFTIVITFVFYKEAKPHLRVQ